MPTVTEKRKRKEKHARGGSTSSRVRGCDPLAAGVSPFSGAHVDRLRAGEASVVTRSFLERRGRLVGEFQETDSLI